MYVEVANKTVAIGGSNGWRVQRTTIGLSKDNNEKSFLTFGNEFQRVNLITHEIFFAGWNLTTNISNLFALEFKNDHRTIEILASILSICSSIKQDHIIFRFRQKFKIHDLVAPKWFNNLSQKNIKKNDLTIIIQFSTST